MYECVCVCECVSVCNILINAIRFTAWPWAPLRLQRHLVYATMQNVGRLAPSRSHLHAHSLNKWNCVSVAAEVAASNSNNNSSEPDVDCRWRSPFAHALLSAAGTASLSLSLSLPLILQVSRTSLNARFAYLLHTSRVCGMKRELFHFYM